ncbi:hypothetical protein N7471_010317 [Penicillium samsonianum]|uniref:uncharacterized protein n=1 Tax=Penicillium samsonianum TaxID=1882272 RepID=UPI0025465D37|nr:uncharacterized protein N7471_010317 [Penicillium samsonianum]KAJ6125824.1 hypothetical protein N7471_010317 [Penicillium samsonianum]
MNREGYVEYSDWRPMIFEAFLWKVMVTRIFNNFWWAGIIGTPMTKVYASMSQSFSSNAADILIFQIASYDDNFENLVGQIRDAINPYRISKPGGLTKAIRDVLVEAIALDEELSRPLAQFKWDFPEHGEEFDAGRMQAADVDASNMKGPISIVICPGIKKRGRSGDFEKEDILLTSKVSCAAPISALSESYGSFQCLCNRLKIPVYNEFDPSLERLQRYCYARL